jgi:hypothetical protein
MTIPSIYSKVKDATVALAVLKEGDPQRPFEIVGSGFCVDLSGIVITCAHVLSAFMTKPIHQQIAEISDKEKHKEEQRVCPVSLVRPHAVFYRVASPEKLHAFPSMVDHIMAKTDFDLGMVRLLPHTAFPDGYPYLEIEDYTEISEGNEVVTCGFPLGAYLHDQLGTVTSSFTRGIISSIIPAQGVAVEYLEGFQLNLTAAYGNSGGPVVSLSSGNVLGVLQGGVLDYQGKILPGLSRAEPVYPVLSHDALSRIKGMPRI